MSANDHGSHDGPLQALVCQCDRLLAENVKLKAALRKLQVSRDGDCAEAFNGGKALDTSKAALLRATRGSDVASLRAERDALAEDAEAEPAALNGMERIARMVGEEADKYWQSRRELEAERDALNAKLAKADDLITNLHLANQGINHYDWCRNNVASGADPDGPHECMRCYAERVQEEAAALKAKLAEAEQVSGPAASLKQTLTLARFREVNVSRCLSAFHDSLDDWSPAEWGCALAGEVGELCNLLKKYIRQQPGDGHKSELLIGIADEIGDVLAYLDLCAARLGIDLERATVNKFNRVSERVGAKERL